MTYVFIFIHIIYTGALLNKENDEKIKQIESKLEAEKDEMMEAMAQEIEVLFAYYYWFYIHN